jgi:PrgI family protein
MREHPIPQDITGYKFHIVGNMTIKQFGEIIAGVIVGVAFYATNLPNFIKWPLIAFFVGMGVAVAFVPIEERPLDHWIITFIKILYKPTKFFWKREPKIPEAFTYTPEKEAVQLDDPIDLSPARRQRIKEYLNSIDVVKKKTDFDINEQTRINQILDSFDTVTVALTQITKTVQTKPNLNVRIRDLKKIEQETTEETAVSEQIQPALGNSHQQAPDLTQKQSAVSVYTDTRKFSIPEERIIAVDKKHAQDILETDEKTIQTTMAYVAPIVEAQQDPTQLATQAQTNRNLPFPSIPQKPNLIAGMVLSTNDEILNDSIIEIRNQQDQIVRAVKTNALGQFFITTPLDEGVYSIDIEKEGFQFNTQQITLIGDIVQPIEIRSIV